VTVTSGSDTYLAFWAKVPLADATITAATIVPADLHIARMIPSKELDRRPPGAGPVCQSQR
jgi:hypothetical protein